MAARKIKLKDQLGRVVRVPTATATPAPTTPPVTQPEPARPAATVWKLIREIPANIQKLAKLVGTGFTTRGPDGEWFQRQIEAGEGIVVADGDGVAGNPSIGLAELPDAGGGTLQKTLRDDYGRLAGTSAATTSDLAEGGNLYFTDERADARIAAQKGVANGLATLDAGAKLPANQLPALAITDTFVVASQAAMLALTAERGDVAVRTDLQKSFILAAEPATALANWQELLVPTGTAGTVTSVALSVPTGLVVAGSPITASGTFTVSYATGYQGYTAAEATKLAGIATGATVGAAWGTNLSGIPASISSLAGLTTSANQGVYLTAPNNWAAYPLTPAGRALLDDADAPAQRTTLGLASGTTGQFWRGDGSWSSALTADMRVQKGVPGYEMVSANGQNGWRFIGNVNDSADFGFAIGQLVSGSWAARYAFSTVAMAPTADNTLSSGRADARWTVVHAATGAINTSDEREKTAVRPFTAAELAAAAELGREIGVYQWLAMIAEKGGAARQHIGMTVQGAIAILELHGLDPFAYGFICYDQWDELPVIRDEEGKIVQEYRPAGDRYSFRMDELLAFIARGLAHRLDTVEQRLAAAGL